MIRTNPLVTAAIVAGLILAAMIFGPRRHADRQQPLAGNLFSADADTSTARGRAAQQDDLPLPELRVTLDASARASLPPGLDFIVHLVPAGLSKITLTAAQSPTLPTDKGLEQKFPGTSLHGRQVKPSSRHAHKTPQKLPERVPTLTAATAPQMSTSTPVPAQQPVQVVVAPLAPAAPIPTQAMTFAQLDEALRAAPTTQTVNLRTKQGGVTFRITAVGRVGDRQVIRYAIANEEDSDFFVSIVNVSAAGKPLRSETAGPYSCAAGSEVYGIVHFPPAASQTVAVELVQSGGQRRRFSLKPEIPL
jgi:hypothetical protein